MTVIALVIVIMTVIALVIVINARLITNDCIQRFNNTFRMIEMFK